MSVEILGEFFLSDGLISWKFIDSANDFIATAVVKGNGDS